jgi:hypothetical protein
MLLKMAVTGLDKPPKKWNQPFKSFRTMGLSRGWMEAGLAV